MCYNGYYGSTVSISTRYIHKKNNKLKFAKIKCIMYSIRIITEMKTNVKIITNGCNEHMPSKHKR